jgi:hypothetical protein
MGNFKNHVECEECRRPLLGLAAAAGAGRMEILNECAK